jgi:hypothetical protein
VLSSVALYSERHSYRGTFTCGLHRPLVTQLSSAFHLCVGSTVSVTTSRSSVLALFQIASCSSLHTLLDVCHVQFEAARPTGFLSNNRLWRLSKDSKLCGIPRDLAKASTRHQSLFFNLETGVSYCTMGDLPERCRMQFDSCDTETEGKERNCNS